jgi:hypothetical protein
MAEGRPQARLVLATAAAIIAVILIFSSQFLIRFNIENPGGRTGYAGGLLPSLIPSTFRVEVRKSFRLAATGDFDPDCSRVSAVVPELGFAQTFTRKELFNGVSSELNPSKTGVFYMTFLCRDREIGSAPLTVVVGLQSAKKPTRWVLSTTKAIYQEKSFFQLPVTVRAEQQSSGTWLPFPVAQDTHFLLRDGKGQLRQPPDLTIDRNTAISIPVWIDLPVRAEYALIAYKNDPSHQSTNEVKVSWQEQGPKLGLVSFPQELTIYNAPISHGNSKVYLADGEFRVRPPENLDVLVDSPVGVVSDPFDKLELTPQQPFALYQASAGSAGASTTTVRFREPMTGTTAALLVHILSPIRFLILASITGLVGVIVARGSALFAQKRWAIVVEILSAIAAGFLLYSAELQKWLPLVGTPDFTLSYLAAGAIGLVGGFLGLAVFKGIAALFGLKLT